MGAIGHENTLLFGENIFITYDNLCEDREQKLALLKFIHIHLNPVFVSRAHELHESEIDVIVFEFLYFDT